MARKTKAEAARTRERILKAALDLFFEKGYERATFEDVARRIRLTKGAVYWHFKTKPDLLMELAVDMTAAHSDTVGRELSEPSTLDTLQTYLVERAKLVVNDSANRKFFFLLTRMDLSSARFATLRQRLRQLETGVFAVIERTLLKLQREGAVRSDLDVPAVTSILGAMWLGLIKLEVNQCLDVDLTKAARLGFGMINETIRA